MKEGGGECERVERLGAAVEFQLPGVLGIIGLGAAQGGRVTDAATAETAGKLKADGLVLLRAPRHAELRQEFRPGTACRRPHFRIRAQSDGRLEVPLFVLEAQAAGEVKVRRPLPVPAAIERQLVHVLLAKAVKGLTRPSRSETGTHVSGVGLWGQ